nr:MAG TPA: pepsin inhibitor [Caudoviricetes sp.]
MNQYVFVLNAQGKRITSFVDNTVTQEQLLATAKQEYPNAADYIYSADGDSMLDEFMRGKLYVNGQFVAAPVHELTKAEKIAEIRSYYNRRFETLDQALIRRRLANGDISDLQEQFKKINTEMIAKIKAVK